MHLRIRPMIVPVDVTGQAGFFAVLVGLVVLLAIFEQPILSLRPIVCPNFIFVLSRPDIPLGIGRLRDLRDP